MFELFIKVLKTIQEIEVEGRNMSGSIKYNPYSV